MVIHSEVSKQVTLYIAVRVFPTCSKLLSWKISNPLRIGKRRFSDTRVKEGRKLAH